MGLQINRDKTRVVNLTAEAARLDFLGYQFGYERSGFRPDRRYLRLEPSAKALARERETLRQMTGPVVCRKPIRRLVFELNRHLKGWREYFKMGYPQRAFRKIGWYARERLVRHLRRRSQRPFRPPEGTTWYRHLLDLGLVSM